MVARVFDYPPVTTVDRQCPLFHAQTMPDYARTMPEASSSEISRREMKRQQAQKNLPATRGLFLLRVAPLNRNRIRRIDEGSEGVGDDSVPILGRVLVSHCSH